MRLGLSHARRHLSAAGLHPATDTPRLLLWGCLACPGDDTLPISDIPLPITVLAIVAALGVVLRWLVWAVLVIRANRADLPAIARALGSSSRALPIGRQNTAQGDDTVSPG